MPAREGNKFYPFCCERCQLVDLGKWLDEDYKVPDAGGEGYGPGSRGEPG
jgi:endogenous inhibitor of DNA gyrase (YacG/DUF329 family)